MCKALLADKGRSQIANIQSCCDNAKTWMTSYYYTPSRQIRKLFTVVPAKGLGDHGFRKHTQGDADDHDYHDEGAQAHSHVDSRLQRHDGRASQASAKVSSQTLHSGDMLSGDHGGSGSDEGEVLLSVTSIEVFRQAT
jgi:hypothetical protein